MLKCVWEHNGNDTLLYCEELVGAYARGESLEAALAKLPGEAASYLAWLGEPPRDMGPAVIVQEKSTDLRVADADSDVLFDSEREPLTQAEYQKLKALALRSARDMHALYTSVADPDVSCLPQRQTFYGPVPVTARQMYAHTQSVNSYYFGEIGVEADNGGDILACRERGFARLEQLPGCLTAGVTQGSCGELWSLRKVLRRFVWHDRIHARAMYRMAIKTFGPDGAANVFRF